MINSPMYLKPTGVSCSSTPCRFGQRVDQIRGCYRFGHAIFPAPALDQVVKQKRDHVVRLKKRPIGVDDAEAVGVAVGRNSNLCSRFAHLSFAVFRANDHPVPEHVRRTARRGSRALSLPPLPPLRNSSSEYPRAAPHMGSNATRSLALRITSRSIISAQTFQVSRLRIERFLSRSIVRPRMWQATRYLPPQSPLRSCS